MAQQKEILIVDDEVGIRELLSEILQDEGYRVSLAENAGEARTYRARTQPSLVLLDIWMPDTDGVTLLREWAANGQLTMPVVMMSGHGTIETAVEATKIGAFDFLEKPVGLQKLLSTITRALKTAAGQGPRRISLAALGTSAPVIEVERAIEQLLRANRPLLIVGEPGAGHEIVARALHVPETPFVEHADRRAPGDQSAAGARGGARWHAVLRRNRHVFEGGAERARVPAVQTRTAQHGSGLHQQRAARQSRGRRALRSRLAREPVRRRGHAAAAAPAARGHPGHGRSLLARNHRQSAHRCDAACVRRRRAVGGVLAGQHGAPAQRHRQSRADRRQRDHRRARAQVAGRERAAAAHRPLRRK